MKKYITKLLFIPVLVVFNLGATEFRSTYLSERGPIRYKFNKKEEGKLNIWALAYRREAHKAFLKHGTDTQPLTALLFNSANIQLNKIFPNNDIPDTSEYYSPYMDIMTIYPRITYYEHGINLGTKFAFSSSKRTRMGIRLNVPFRVIEIERENITDREADPKKDYVLSRAVSLETGNDSVKKKDVNRTVSIYSFNLLHRLKQDDRTTPAVQYGNKTVRIFGQELAVPNGVFASDNQKMKTNLGSPAAAVIYKSGTGTPGKPAEPQGARQEEHWAFNTGDDEGRDYKDAYVKKDGKSADGKGSAIIKNAVFFSKGVDYTTKLDTNNKIPYLDNNGWLILGYDNAVLSTGARNIKEGIDDALALYTENPYQWMLSKGDFEFETDRKTGLGDIDIDLFFAYQSDSFMWEIFGGAKIPTGTGDEYYGNPYRVHLGNGEHFEAKGGMAIGLKMGNSLNIKLDGYYSYVFKATEKRTAVFEGSDIKNIGPRADADVEWQYVVSHLDFTFFHPNTKNISSTFGYEFYYKTKDYIKFKNSTALPWYGNNIDGTSNEKNLDNNLAAKNTESFGHKVRFESRCQINDKFEILVGGSFTVAGQNLPRELDCHGGFNLRF